MRPQPRLRRQTQRSGRQQHGKAQPTHAQAEFCLHGNPSRRIYMPQEGRIEPREGNFAGPTVVRCKGADSRARRNAADWYRLTLK